MKQRNQTESHNTVKLYCGYSRSGCLMRRLCTNCWGCHFYLFLIRVGIAVVTWSLLSGGPLLLDASVPGDLDNGPVMAKVFLANGSVFSGGIVPDTAKESIELLVQEGKGRAVMIFPVQEIQRIRFRDTKDDSLLEDRFRTLKQRLISEVHGNTDTQIRLNMLIFQPVVNGGALKNQPWLEDLDLLISDYERQYAQRAPFFYCQDYGQIAFFTPLIELLYMRDRLAEATAIAETLLARLTSYADADSEAWLAPVQRLIALCLWHQGRKEEAMKVCRDLITKQRQRATSQDGCHAPPLNGFAYSLLARILLDTDGEDPATDALHAALTPVTFAGPLDLPYLGHCYAVAIAAADRVGAGDELRYLAGEMTARGLLWPPDLQLPVPADAQAAFAGVSITPVTNLHSNE